MPSTTFFTRKLARYALTIMVIIVINFLIPRLMPGDPVAHILGEDVYSMATPDVIEEYRRKYGLDRPWHEQFATYLWNLVHGDLGYSFSFSEPISSLILDRLPRTLLITLPATGLGVVIGALLGAWSGWRRWERPRRAVALAATLLYSTPPYWVGMIMLLVFSLHLRLTPIGGAPPAGSSILDYATYMALPVTTLLIYMASCNLIIMRGAVIEVAEEDFVAVALSKGLKEHRFLYRHVLRPSLPPLIALSAIEFGFAFSGSLFVEIVYSWPGMGSLMWDAVVARDYPLLQAVFTLSAIIVVAANAVADLLTVLLDPRLREV